MPNYSKAGKRLTPLSESDFINGMNNGKFCQRKHRGFAALLFHTGIRCSEALRAMKEQFSVEGERLFFDVGKRLKRGKHTPPLTILLSKPFAHEILNAVDKTESKKRVFPYCRKTGFNIIARVWFYPHHLRLSKITGLFLKEFTIPQVRTFTGLTLMSLDYYIGLVTLDKMAAA